MGASGSPRDDSVERAVWVLVEAFEAAVEELGATVPPAQLRAVLLVERLGRPSLSRLATALGASASATSRLCDRMEAAGLLERVTVDGRRGIALVLTSAGMRLAEWVTGQRRAALTRLLDAMTPAGRAALEEGLRDLHAAANRARAS